MTPALAVRGLSKAFGGAQALRGVDLTVMPGEIHGLLGENGSGKSTLIKILAGYHAPDEGELAVNGDPVSLPLSPGQFRSLGFDFVHQDLGLIPSLSVLENLRVAAIASPSNPWYLSWAHEKAEASAALARYGTKLPLSRAVKDLAPIDRALLAIVRAVEGLRSAGQHGVLVLDEPTVFLPTHERQRLFDLLRRIAAYGASVLFVSHNLDEVVGLTDRITVLRDGKAVGTVDTATVTKAELVKLIIGHALADGPGRGTLPAAQPVRATVTGLTGSRASDVDFDIRQGEVLGLTGLVGSAFEEIPYLLFGAHRGTGSMQGEGLSLDISKLTPGAALKNNIALIPSNRLRDGSIASVSAMDNLTLPILDAFFVGFRLRRGRMRAATQDLMTAFDVRPADPAMRYGAFSGGNQQKVLLAKWLQLRPKLLLLHEPTQGVDVGAREQIYRILREARANGTSIVCASSDHEELALIADRVLVFGEHAITGELSGADITKERIAHMSYSVATSKPRNGNEGAHEH